MPPKKRKPTPKTPARPKVAVPPALRRPLKARLHAKKLPAIVRRSSLPAPEEGQDYLPLPAGHPPTVSLLKKMEAEFEESLSRPRVSVVVVNHDGVDFLWHCLFALKTQTYSLYEIILVDNGSEDASVSFVKSNYPQVKVLECQENFGFAMGANLGARYATGDLVVLLNNDAVVTPDWLSRLVAEFQEEWPGAALWASSVRPNQGAGKQAEDRWVLNFLGNPVEGFFADPHTVFYAEGSVLMYPRYLATEGPFDPDYFIYQEDVYLGWKFRLANKKVFRSLDAKVFHEPGGTMSRFQGWKTVYYQTRNRWLNLLLFYEWGNLLKLLPWIAAEAFFRQVKGLGKGFHYSIGNLFAILWVLFHPVAILRKRTALQEKRKARDREILRYLSGRVALDRGFLSRLLNFISLAYCLVMGLEVMEFHREN